MSFYEVDGEKVKAFLGFAKRTHKILKECGNVFTESWFLENFVYYDYKRQKREKPLGRASIATEEEQENNQRRLAARRKTAIMDLANCNEAELDKWHTFTYAENVQDIDQAIAERESYLKRLERFVRSGSLYGAPVRNFTLVPGFDLKALGVIQFQDGERREDGCGRGAIHFHQIMNAPYIPQVQVIVGICRQDDETWQENYYQTDGTWGKVAGPHTYWKPYRHEVMTTVQTLQDASDKSQVVDIKSKPLCALALLWGHGFIDIDLSKRKYQAGDMSTVGEYMVKKYMTNTLGDSRLAGRKLWYKRGELKRPVKYHDEWEIEQIKYYEGIDDRSLVSTRPIDCEYLGKAVITVWNLMLTVYPNMTEYFRKRVEVEIFNTNAIIAEILGNPRDGPCYGM